MPATISVRDDIIEVLSAPDWTKARLFELQQALRDAQRLAEKDIGAAVARVAEVDERTAGLLLRLAAGWTKEDTWKLLALLAAILAIVVPQISQRGQLSESDVRRIVDEQMDQRESPLAPPAVPPTAPPGTGTTPP